MWLLQWPQGETGKQKDFQKQTETKQGEGDAYCGRTKNEETWAKLKVNSL